MRFTSLLPRTVFALGLCAGLAGCGDNFGEQALFGAGAGVGAATLLDGNVFTGAALGAAANVVYCQENPGSC
ncbi:MAG: hypothetical protein AB3N11_04335 [Arenibacterium sp.]